MTEPTPTPKSRLAIIGPWLVFGLLGGLLLIVGVQLFNNRQGPLTSGPAPEFTLETFDGESIALSDLRGQVVVINFWASWCGPCEEEAADLEQAWRDYRPLGVTFLGVDYVDTEPEARAYLAKWDVTYPNGPDLGTNISRAFRIRGVPETFVLDQQGEVRQLFIGPVDYETLTAVIETLLNE